MNIAQGISHKANLLRTSKYKWKMCDQSDPMENAIYVQLTTLSMRSEFNNVQLMTDTKAQVQGIGEEIPV